MVQALIDNLIGRGLDPTVCRLFIIDGAKALSQGDPQDLRPATRRSSAARFTRPATSSSGCPSHCMPPVRKALRQAWELDDADKAERLLRNLARRLEREAPGVSASILCTS